MSLNLEESLYCPDLAPFDFDVCPKVKSQIKGRRFSSLPELRSTSANIISQYNQDWYRATFNKWVKRHRECIAYNGEYFEKKWQVSDWLSQFNKPTLLTSRIAPQACSASVVVIVFKAPYVIGKWLNVYRYFSSYRRKSSVFSSVCFIAVCEILHSREKKSYLFEDPSYMYSEFNVWITHAYWMLRQTASDVCLIEIPGKLTWCHQLGV